jgi:hypothetical protein
MSTNPRLDHLLGRLREPRLVAVDRRNVEKSRQKQQQPAQREERDRADMTDRHKIDHACEPAAGFTRFLAGVVSKSGAG